MCESTASPGGGDGAHRQRQSPANARDRDAVAKAGVEYNVLVNGRQWKLLQSTTKPRSRSSGRGGSSSAVRGGTSPIASGRDFATTSVRASSTPAAPSTFGSRPDGNGNRSA